MLSIFKTSDGSDTIYDDIQKNYYHSVHGALTESRHVFIEHGLQLVYEKHSSIRIFEMGFGTGLNAYLSYLFSETHPSATIHYTAIEKFPLPETIFRQLNYPELLNVPVGKMSFIDFHQSAWNEQLPISDQFYLHKIAADVLTWEALGQYELIYMDAFSPNDQAELWTDELMEKFYQMLDCDGLLTTYCAKGSFKRSLKKVGFRVMSAPGPMGKREMTLAYK